MKQLRLDLDDRQQYLKQIIESENLGSDSWWYIMRYAGYLWLTVRTHDLGGTDYSYKERLSIEEAEWILATDFTITKAYNLRSGRITELFTDTVKQFKEMHHK